MRYLSKPLWPSVVLLALAGCDATGLVDRALARTAESVVAPVTGSGAARCIVDNASSEELRALARDIGVEAGTSTLANIATITSRPATQACLVGAGLQVPRI